MKGLDLESIEWVLSQEDIKLKYSFAKCATGNERLDKAPRKAGFFWSRGTQLEYSIEVTRDELCALIQALGSRGIKVPDEFHEALRNFPN